jgi:hypothetical protein
MNVKSLVAGVIALVIAFLFGFVINDPGTSELVIGLLATVGGFFGITNFRSTFDSYAEMFKTKTMAGALIVAVPMLGYFIITIFGIEVSESIMKFLEYIIQIGGGWLVLGASHALAKKEAKTL